MAIAKASGLKAKCDKLFSKIVRFHGACENCDYVCGWECKPQEGSHRAAPTCKLQCAHVITRHLSATRCHLGNAFPLCYKCHKRFELHPVEFGIFYLDRRDRATYNDLSSAAIGGATVNWSTVYEELSAEWERLRAEWGLF